MSEKNNTHTHWFHVTIWLFLAIFVSCSKVSETDGKDKVALVTSLEESPYQVELKIFRLPEGLRSLNHMSYSLNMGKDGLLYVGIGNNHDNGHLLQFDPETERITDLGNFRDTMPREAFHRGNYGKFHVGPYQDFDGAVYFASHAREWWDGEESGRLFKYTKQKGVVDLGPTPNNQSVYFMYGDDRNGKLYLAMVNSHFSIYDLKTGRWEDKGRFTSKAPFYGLTDQAGRLYMYGYDGKGDRVAGPPTIARYDPELQTLRTSKNAPPTAWVGAVSPDHEVVYTTNYQRAEIFRWRLSDWPDYQVEELGLIDPSGGAVYSNNLSLTPDNKRLVLAGSIFARKRYFWKPHMHGLWIYDIESGKKYLAANLGQILSESFGLDANMQKFFWTNANTVDKSGWIYIGVHSLPPDSDAKARLMAVRIQPKVKS